MMSDLLTEDLPPISAGIHSNIMERQHSFSRSIDGSREDVNDDTDGITRMMHDLWSTDQDVAFPSKETSMGYDNVDRMVAKGMYEMNKSEREAIVEELHGVKSRAVVETPAMVEIALKAFEEETTLLRTGRIKEMDKDVNGKNHPIGKAHLRAVEVLRSNYVTAPEFRIRFLRAEFFHVKRAVRRYYKYLNHVWDLFGDVALVRQIELNDLNRDEIKYLKGGQLQSLLSRDKMGRKIYAVFGMYSVSIMERARVDAYLAFAANADDEITQIYGATYIVFLALNEKSVVKYDPREYHIIIRCLNCNPFRMTALHFCMPSQPMYNFFKTMATAMIRPEMRVSTRFHFGSHLECNYALCQFGIPVDDIPKSITGNIKSKSVEKFIKARMAIEEYRRKRCQLLGVRYVTKAMEDALVAAASSHIPSSHDILLERLNGFPPSCPGTDCPGLDCIVFGDRVTYKHPPNVRFRDFLRGKRHHQEQLKEQERQQNGKVKRQKERIFSAEFLDDIIQETCDVLGFRFASYEKEAGWYAYIEPVTTENRQELRKKISQLMRDERKRERAFISVSSGLNAFPCTEKDQTNGNYHSDLRYRSSPDITGSVDANITSFMATEQDAKRFKKFCEGCDFGGAHSCL